MLQRGNSGDGSVIIKVFERVIRKQIVTFLISNEYLNPTQHGFRGGHSCLSAC